ncbi:MAG: hypothetical protein FWG63_03930 [Defluviitaleaceae bacterium]|nr:hypothetical protein [Defluviitaleaceae bacterium]
MYRINDILSDIMKRIPDSFPSWSKLLDKMYKILSAKSINFNLINSIITANFFFIMISPFFTIATANA